MRLPPTRSFASLWQLLYFYFPVWLHRRRRRRACFACAAFARTVFVAWSASYQQSSDLRSERRRLIAKRVLNGFDPATVVAIIFFYHPVDICNSDRSNAVKLNENFVYDGKLRKIIKKFQGKITELKSNLHKKKWFTAENPLSIKLCARASHRGA